MYLPVGSNFAPTGRNLLITSFCICELALSIEPMDRTIAVSPIGISTSMKSRKSLMFLSMIMMARGTAARRSTW